MFKKFLAIALSLCLALAMCGAALAAEKGDKVLDSKTAPQVISVLGRLAKLADASEADEDDSFLELLGGEDALNSDKFNDNYEKIFTKLYNAATVDDIMSLLGVKEDNDITIRNYFGIDADAFEGVDPSAEITDEFIANIGEILGYEDANLEDLLSTLFMAAMISVYYPSLEFDMADLVATLEGLSELYEAGYFDDIDLADEKVIADLASEFGIDFEDIQSPEQLRKNSQPASKSESEPEDDSKEKSDEEAKKRAEGYCRVDIGAMATTNGMDYAFEFDPYLSASPSTVWLKPGESATITTSCNIPGYNATFKMVVVSDEGITATQSPSPTITVNNAGDDHGVFVWYLVTPA